MGRVAAWVAANERPYTTKVHARALKPGDVYTAGTPAMYVRVYTTERLGTGMKYLGDKINGVDYPPNAVVHLVVGGNGRGPL
jgi:hypothetical protein